MCLRIIIQLRDPNQRNYCACVCPLSEPKDESLIISSFGGTLQFDEISNFDRANASRKLPKDSAVILMIRKLL
jgi:hypothetical protein